MKKNFKLISNAASILILSITLIISVSYAWYTNNKDVSSTGIASTSSNSISVLNQGMYKKVIGDVPFPETDKKNEVDGVLSGDVIYYSVSIGLAKDKNKDINYDLNISVVNINGGEYFVEPAIRIEENPNGTSTGETYTFEGESYDVYTVDNKDYFIINDSNGDDYIYYLYESASGQVLTRKPRKIIPNPNGSATGNTFEYEGVKYPTYLDAEGKEYFLTYDVTEVDGVQHIKDTYINYIYEQTVDGNKVRYNMCDVYTIGIFKVFGVDESRNYTQLLDKTDNLELMKINKESGLDKEVHFFNLFDYEGWDPSVYEEIVFTFAIKFDYSEFEGDINVNCVSNKELIFTNVIISETESEVSE